MLHVARNSEVFDRAWLRACEHTLVWQSAGASFYRLSNNDGGWDAVFLPRSRESVRSPQAEPSLRRYANSDLWLDTPTAILEEDEYRVMVFDTTSIVLGLLSPSPASLQEFLPRALSMVRALAAAHADGAQLGSLHPIDFAVDQQGIVRLRMLPATATTGAQTLGVIDEIICRAPEQLRPVAPQCDNRSDLYALGMILFRHLTGIFPLAANSPVEWRHAHLALAPMDASSMFPDLPPVMGRILKRLLAKEPAGRYQSALALEFDLARCEQELSENGAISDFEIGRVDAPFAQLWTSALFGRGEEEEILGNVLGRFLDHGKPSMISVHGQPGVGKSSLVKSVARMAAERALFIQGKSDQHQSEVPYGPIVQAISAFIDEAVRVDHETLASLRKALARELQGNASLLIDLMPAIEILTGPQASRIDVPGPMVQLRLQRALRALLSVVAATISPLVLFLDDVQWADEATRAFLSVLVNEPVRGLLLIVARREQLGEAQALCERLIADARVSLAEVAELHLRPLTLQSTRQMLGSIFSDAPEGLGELAETLHEKTGGNPFYLRRLLQALVQDGVVYFSPSDKTWMCRVEDVSRYPASENIISFVAARLEKEGPEALGLLQTMACIGPEADKAVLASALGLTEDTLQQLAAPLARSGFVVLSPAKLSFAHDRIQEAAYSLMDAATRRDRHRHLIDVMMRVWDSGTNAAAFAIANQIEQCPADDLPLEKRKLFIEALLAALAHARRSAAFGQAVRYGETAVGLIQDDLWVDDYALAFRAHILLCEALLGAASLEAAESRLNDLLQYARSALDRSAVFRLRANLLTLKSDYEGSIDEALLGLGELGVKLARGSSEAEQDEVYRAIRRRLDGRRISDLEHMPLMDDPRIRAAMSLLAPLISSVFTTDGLRFLHLAKMVELTLDHGASPESTHGLAWFGAIISDKYDAYVDGLDFCLAARALVDKYGFEEHRTSVLLAVDQVSPWTRSLPYALERVREALDAAHAAGDVGWMCYARNHLVSDLIAMGEEIPNIRREAEESIAVTRRFGYTDIEHILAAQLRLVVNLAEGKRDGQSSANLTQTAPVVSATTAFWVAFYDGTSLYYNGAYAAAVEKLLAADALSIFLLAHIDTGLCKFYLGLALAALKRDASAENVADRRLQDVRARLALWADLNPLNFADKLLLLDAEIARRNRNYAEALVFYEKAATAARSSRFEHEHALALERAGVCCLEMGNRISANAYLSLASEAYERWGAGHKARSLRTSLTSDATRRPSAAQGLASAAGDLDTVLGTSLALSEEIVLDRVIETLMTRMLVHAGANRGLLLKIADGRLEAEASAWIEGDSVRVSTIDPDRHGLSPPYSVIDRALQTRMPFVISGSDFGSWAADKVSAAGRSILCVPLLRRGELTGLLCLQNDYLEGVFAADTVALLKLLASQAAISLENARLYTKLLQENDLRARSEQALAGARAELEKNARLTLLGGIAASVTHELGQPLSAIASNAGAGLRWLRRAEPDIAETLSVLTEIETSVSRAHDIIRALRALSKQAPKVEEIVDVNEVILEVLCIARSEIERHGTEIHLDLSAAEATVLGDATQLKQVVLNLLHNGMEAMTDLPAQRRKIEIGTRRSGTEIVVSVRDFGSGIPPEIASQIFEPMFTTKTSGMGMGLAICKSIIDAHQGVLTVVAEPMGTKFTFSIPLSSGGNG
ncbi:ATP-binding sensor histidine kinase [Rhizobium sp. RU36D]|uniref:trifunctional serine/threonine-protein kinase/ATP-binding protein/sensor histidine kinase n=1 Tax=Rhizobium sp. RU36D TaxID=1907415 RepID=UPI0009D7FEFC|nr:ATP-binding sensor histidine kinase [Rhizobium sp. RU36D]SMD13753.1 Predicted ATPase [Rhizobium sp. RU36D]